jgi:predicted DNA-binding protein (UPF0251 family)
MIRFLPKWQGANVANKRISMRKIREVLRLCWDKGLSSRQASGSCGVARGTVRNILDRAETAHLSWPLPEDLDDAGRPETW